MQLHKKQRYASRTYRKTEKSEGAVMSNDNHIPPEFKKRSFTCPYCKVTTQQQWHTFESIHKVKSTFGYYVIPRLIEPFNSSAILDIFSASICYHCLSAMVWHNENPIYPITGYQPPPHTDMPENIRLIYEEAASISQLSPRASCALMRYAIEEFIKGMGYKDDLFDNIGKMYKESIISVTIKDGLDIVRVTGNNALHGNKIDISDQTTVHLIFTLINQIVEELISIPKEKKSLSTLFSKGELKAIEKRDTE